MTQPVKCVCGSLFGMEQPDGSLAIKYRDLFRVVKGSVSGPCRKCGAMVEWPTAPYTIPPTTTTWKWTVPTRVPTVPSSIPSMPPQSFSCNCACQRCTSGECCMIL